MAVVIPFHQNHVDTAASQCQDVARPSHEEDLPLKRRHVLLIRTFGDHRVTIRSGRR